MGSYNQNTAATEEFPAMQFPPARQFPPGRYGRRRERRRPRRAATVGLLAAVLVLAGGVTLRLYQMYSADVINVRVTAFTVVSDDKVHVQFTVSKDPGSTVTCSVRARAEDGTEVGRAQVVVPAHSPETTDYTLATNKKAITGEVLRCVPGEHAESGSPVVR